MTNPPDVTVSAGSRRNCVTLTYILTDAFKDTLPLCPGRNAVNIIINTKT